MGLASQTSLYAANSMLYVTGSAKRALFNYGAHAQFSVWPHIRKWVIKLVNPDYFITAK